MEFWCIFFLAILKSTSLFSHHLFKWTSRQNVHACASLSISSPTFQSDQSLRGALGFTLCAVCGSVVLLSVARIFGYLVLIEISFMDNQAQFTETISWLDYEKVSL